MPVSLPVSLARSPAHVVRSVGNPGLNAWVSMKLTPFHFSLLIPPSPASMPSD